MSAYQRKIAVAIIHFSMLDQALSALATIRDEADARLMTDPTSDVLSSLFPDPIQGVINGYYTFLMADSGSKDGWPEDERAGEFRARFIELFKPLASDGVLEVQWGDYDTSTTVHKASS